MSTVEDIRKYIIQRIKNDKLPIIEDNDKEYVMFYFFDSVQHARTSLRLTIRGNNANSQASTISIGIEKSGDDNISLKYFGKKFNELRNQLEKYGLKKPSNSSQNHYQITCNSKDSSKMIGFIDELLNLHMSATQKKSNNPQTVLSDIKPENQISETNTDLTCEESDIPDAFTEIEEYKHEYEHLNKTERNMIIKSRIGQGRFREEVMDLWERRCSVTGMNNCSILKASHIKPWRDSTNEERLDRYNGLLLIPNLDTLFDQGFISFNEEGKIMISTNLSKEDRDYLGVKDDFRLKMFAKTKEYMKYHRDNIYKNNVK